jgi:DNA-binding transcriptional ArsR family regulator
MAGHGALLVGNRETVMPSQWQVIKLAADPLRLPLPPMTLPPLEALADYFKVFSEPNRLAVLDALRQGPLNVTAVVERTGLSQALVSKHLKLLTIAGVVKRRPEGSLVFYEVADKGVFRLIAQAEKQLLAARRQQLDALAAIL